jgi:nitric oxide reductase NorD protein
MDSSLSTESYIAEKQTLEKIKNITNTIATSINNIINNFAISAFYSNTRHDCRYILIKEFKENWNTQKNKLNQLIPTGYTRIGPAIRHSINILKKLKTEQKIIILITDGNPTDYDEYEGTYGINDIKKTLKEALKLKINVIAILISGEKQNKISQIFGPRQHCTIYKEKLIHNKLIKLINNIISTKK